ncbi:amidohydrolase 2 [Melanomma pulvis-pyrius CBS 109.77]|uniref:Amidohydrolase 2 n=1 Tax=Melanomma pulvis-pyrius CBS 109.77 TaxID=1314802 RepID=A0A6A6X7X4_9PLEO|nr:amidohydrolase 2 [Melanomma pulvis-pyrius CBS 109.77]
MTPPLLSLEEHYYSNAIFSSIGDKFQRTLQAVPGLVDQLLDLGDGRVSAMDRGNISFQVVSHAFTPGGPNARNCQEGNDELATAIAQSGQPARFAAFAVLPISNAAECEHELDRCVHQLGFVGALIDNHADGRHFDSAEYDILWAKACELDVPIYLHPTWPSARMAEAFKGEYPEPVSVSLSATGWGWHGDVGLHVLKLFAAGVFDRFPTLKIIIGHMGETLPFMLERCYDMSTRWGGWGPRERPLRQVWDENIWITTSGAWSLAPIKCILENTRVERIMYSVDYPFESNEKGLEWFERLEASGLLTGEQLEMIAYRNAEQLLKVQATRTA